MLKKIFVTLIAFVLVLTSMPLNVMAQEAIDELTATKISQKVEGTDGEYDIKLSVPGKEAENIDGYNVVIVIDGSYSTDGTKWNKMRESVMSTVKTLLPEEKAEDNLNRVALISFGMGYHINVELTNSVQAFENALPSGDKGGSMLAPGRSATNTEVGLKGAEIYLSTLSEELKKDKEHTYVIYLSDGGANLNEDAFNWYELVKNNTYVSKIRSGAFTAFKGYLLDALSVLTDIRNVSGYENFEANAVVDSAINQIKNLYSQHYTDGETQTFYQMVSSLSEEYKEEFDTLMMSIITEMYEAIGYDTTKTYSASEYERLINSTDFSSRSLYYHYDSTTKQIVLSNEPVYASNGKQINTTINSALEDPFYMPIFYNVSGSNKNITNTIAAGLSLKEYAGTIYTIGFGASGTTANRILNPEYDTTVEHYSDKYADANVNTINTIFSQMIYPIVKINYKNPTLVDYTSKWVIPMDVNGDGKFDEKDITVKNDNIVVDASDLITVTELTEEEIKATNDPELIGNTNGPIYKITWKMTDYLRSWDKYNLTYRVKVDIDEEGFESGKDYKSNGTTTLTYDVIEKDPNGDETPISENNVYDVEVPTVSQILKGKVIAHYIDQFENTLAEDVILEGIVGENYETFVKDIDNYYFAAVDGEETGEFIHGTIEVTYIYSKGIGTGDTEILPPKTGVDMNGFTSIFNLGTVLLSAVYVSKKRY